MDRDRLEHLSIARGIGILLVVIAHSFVPEIRGSNGVISAVFLWICGYAMQLFMLISGYLYQRGYPKYRQNGGLRFYAGKFKALIIPYLSMSALAYTGIGVAYLIPPLARVLASASYSRVSFAESLFQIITLEGHMINHLYFLPTLFLILALTYATGRFFKSIPGMIVCLISFILLDLLPMPHLISRICWLLVFFCFGRFVTFVDTLSQKKMLIPLIPVHFVCLFIQRAGLLSRNTSLSRDAVLPWDVTLDFGLVLNSLVAVAIGVSGALIVLAVSRIIAGKTAGSLIGRLGDNSMIIYLLHQPFIVSGVSGILLMYTFIPHLMICFVTLVPGITIPLLVNRYVITKVRLLRGLFTGDFSKKEKRMAVPND